ncbi:MAG TPA: acylphosphatase [Elusimicrobiota bacterium]|nr:acylphosphatase [Elusimicrobiota bacterium]HNF58091.1 acylphosphatase [Elusimicrobiota bacterium]
MERRRWRIFGRVQGVGFRAFCQREALERGVRGWVRNEPDGSVTAEVEGPPATLDGLLDQLRTAHPWARVERVDVVRCSAGAARDQGFDIAG